MYRAKNDENNYLQNVTGTNARIYIILVVHLKSHYKGILNYYNRFLAILFIWTGDLEREAELERAYVKVEAVITIRN